MRATFAVAGSAETITLSSLVQSRMGVYLPSKSWL